MATSTYDNPNQLSKLTIIRRLAADPVCEVRPQSLEGENGTVYVVTIDSEILTSEEIQTALSTAQTQEEADAITNYLAARVNGLAVPELGEHTAEQVSNYIETQTNPSGLTKQGALDAVDAISTANLATFWAGLKPIIKNMIRSQYEIIALLKLIGNVLVAIRDFIWP